MKPIIRITMGDPVGIGPEIIARALNRTDVYDKCRPVVIGDKGSMEDAVKIANVNPGVCSINNVSEASFNNRITMIRFIEV